MSAPLHLYPAIDLKQGQCVRLTRGEMASAKTYNPDPAAQARAFEAAGFRTLHVVDLDGAFSGKSKNTKAVQSIIHNVSIPIQLGGGIRTRADIDHWLTQGVARVILGTAAARDPDLVRAAARDLPGRIAIGIDAKDGRVAVEGWAEASDLTAEELAKRYAGAGAAALIFTDVARDGVGAGLNVDATRRLAAAVPGTDVIASGGFASLPDIDACRAAGLIHGAIIGRALYEGAIDPAAALKRAGW